MAGGCARENNTCDAARSAVAAICIRGVAHTAINTQVFEQSRSDVISGQQCISPISLTTFISTDDVTKVCGSTPAAGVTREWRAQQRTHGDGRKEASEGSEGNHEPTLASEDWREKALLRRNMRFSSVAAGLPPLSG